MAGTFILSLDCEGKWGVAERMPRPLLGRITEEALEAGYHRLLTLFDRFSMPVTFAFVLAFTLSPVERRKFAHLFRDVQVGGSNWLRFYREAEREGNLSGWFCPRAFDMVQSRSYHEIASHGFSHLPIREDQVSEIDADAELEAATIAARSKGITLETLVYPRNQVGFTELVARHGYIGYRERIERRGNQIDERLRSIARELNLFTKADGHLASRDGMVRIPAGQIFNWRTSLRRMIPPAVTVARWNSIALDAVRSGKVIHLWLHPHNIVTSPSTYHALEKVVSLIARHRDRGGLRVLTQAQYARDRINKPSEDIKFSACGKYYQSR